MLMNTPHKRIVILDRCPALADGLEVLLTTEGYEVLGKFTNAEDAIQFLRENPVDLVLFDIDLEAQSGLFVVESIRQQQSQARFVCYTYLDDNTCIERAINNCGVDGYILKTQPTEQLMAALQSVLDGTPAYSDAIAHHLAGFGSQVVQATDVYSKLSDQQFEAFRLCALGYEVKEVAALVNKSKKTIESALCKVHKHLQIHNRAELVAAAISSGVVRPRMKANFEAKCRRCGDTVPLGLMQKIRSEKLQLICECDNGHIFRPLPIDVTPTQSATTRNPQPVNRPRNEGTTVERESSAAVPAPHINRVNLPTYRPPGN